jgi:hypothetical protein
MKNHNHNLIQQLSETLDGSWRFKRYRKDARGCKSCQKLWQELEKDFKRHEKLIAAEIVSHSKNKGFN